MDFETILQKCDLIVCHECGKVFEDEETVFEIFRSYYDVSKHEFKTGVAVSIASVCNIERVYRFCKRCFGALAGEEYMP